MPIVSITPVPTVKVKVWVAFGKTPFAAVIVTTNGDPIVLGGVPLSTPVVEFKVAQTGNPVALKVGAGEPIAVTVKVPAAPTVKVAWLTLVINGTLGLSLVTNASERP